jgi:hypothetical protein
MGRTPNVSGSTPDRRGGDLVSAQPQVTAED